MKTTKIISLASVIGHSSASAKSELQQKVSQLLRGVSFEWRHATNSKLSCVSLEATIELCGMANDFFFNRSEAESMQHATAATRLSVMSTLLDALEITDIVERKKFFAVALNCDSVYFSQILCKFAA